MLMSRWNIKQEPLNITLHMRLYYFNPYAERNVKVETKGQETACDSLYLKKKKFQTKCFCCFKSFPEINVPVLNSWQERKYFLTKC